jgi:hypothetical protein
MGRSQLAADGGELEGALLVEFVGGELGIEEAFGDGAEHEGEILGEAGGGEAVAVAAGEAGEGDGAGFEEFGELGGGVARGAAGEEVGGELGEAGLAVGFGQEAAAEDGGDVGHGQAGIFAHDEAQAVGKGVGAHVEIGGLAADGGGGFGILGGEDGPRAVFGAQVGAGDAGEIVGGDAADLFEIDLGVARVAGVEFAGGHGAGLAIHGGEFLDGADEDFAAGALDLGGLEGLGLPAGDFGAQGGDDFGFLGGLAFGADAEEAGILGGVAPGVDVEDELAFLAQALDEEGGAAGAGGGGQDVERGGVGVGEIGGMEDPPDAGDFIGAGLAAGALGELRGLGGNEDGGAGGAGDGIEACAEGGFHFGDGDVAGDGEDHVVGRIVAAVVGDEVVAVHGDEDVAPADDGDAVGVDAEGGFPGEAAHDAAGVVLAHVDFAEDDFAFAGPFVFGEGGMEDGIGEDIEADEPAVGGEGGMEDGAVVGGVGVDVAAGIGDFLGDLGGAAGGVPLKIMCSR